MPQHAIETGCVDLVLRPIEIAGELARLSRRFHTPEKKGTKPQETSDARPGDEAALLGRVFQRLRSAHGVDFTHYKRTTIKRRIERRMMLQRIESLEDYCAVLDGDPAELAALYQDFLIRVTEFFRDPVAFDALRQYVLPVLCEGRSRNSRFASGCPAAPPAKKSIRSRLPCSSISVVAHEGSRFRFRNRCKRSGAAEGTRGCVPRECTARSVGGTP